MRLRWGWVSCNLLDCFFDHLGPQRTGVGVEDGGGVGGEDEPGA
jgi:hypothetical protein